MDQMLLDKFRMKHLWAVTGFYCWLFFEHNCKIFKFGTTLLQFTLVVQF